MNHGPALSYVLPLRWAGDEGLEELTSYLRWLAGRAEVIVVDGSPADLYERHAAAWRDLVTHVRPSPRHSFRNGKVAGATTGVELASHERVVIADDDVRYQAAALERVGELLDQHDLVRPQNYFDPLPWHAVWDSARTLLNRAVARDYPGTLGIRKSLFERTGGYDGDVLFENLELIRTVRAAGGREIAPLDLYVRRIPPEAGHFVRQRVRQAYDDFALPARMTLWLLLLPLVAVAVARRSVGSVTAGAAVSMVVAEAGRRRGRGVDHFPLLASLCAPGWLLERGICSWVAVIQRFTRGGVTYGGRVFDRAATPVRELERRFG